MDGRVCAITGAGQGIGRAIAEYFAERGIAVAIVDFNRTQAEEVARGICARGGRAIPVVTDVTDSVSVANMASQIAAELGRCDILINNARWSGLAPTPAIEISDADWQRALSVNVTGAFNCVRALAPGMIAGQWGRIINMSSSTVRVPPSRPYVHYITTKAALIGMTRALAKEFGVHGITVNAMLPGSVETGVERPGGMDSETRARFIRSIQAVPRVMQSADLAGTAFFLASEAAAFITGQSIAVDGGSSFG